MIPLAKNIKRYFSLKICLFVFLAVAVLVSAGISIPHFLQKEVFINDDGKQIVVKTMKTTMKDVLNENGIEVKPFDYTSVSLDTKLQRKNVNEINIKRAVPVTVMADGVEKLIMTCEDTVKDVLENSEFNLSEKDRLDGVSMDDSVKDFMRIKIIRVREEVVSEQIPIPYKVVTIKNENLDKGKEKVEKDGKEGIQEKQFKVLLEDGKEIARELIKDSIILAPINKVVELGTALTYTTSRGEVFRYKKVLDMRATAYTASFKDTGKHPDHPQFGITYSGIRARKGIIAVDPKVIPLGTRVYVEVAGKTPDYGYALAADIGGAIKGNLIDLYFDDQDFVDRWGCKRVKVYILEK